MLHRVFGLLLIYGRHSQPVGLTAMDGASTMIALSAAAGLLGGHPVRLGRRRRVAADPVYDAHRGTAAADGAGRQSAIFPADLPVGARLASEKQAHRNPSGRTAILTGAVSALIVSYLATGLDTTTLKKIFGGFILLVGLSEVFYKAKKAE
jgi:hypothetical protein